MSDIENPPAFPRLDGGYLNHKMQEGMTLRDYFAGQALAMAQADTPKNLAEWAYMVADAMLAQRTKGDAA
jgi:hypothetical protein